MRLICPNCGAQYDVPTEVIPEGGRDVQCSNCGHTWYQRHPDQDAELAEDLNLPVPDPEWTPEAEDDDTTQQAPLPEAQRPIPRTERREAAASEPEAAAMPETVEVTETPRVEEPAKPRGIDPDVAEIFREEREYEARRRAADTLESQPELGLNEPDEDEQARRSRQARERMAKLRGAEPEITARPAPRRPAPPVVPRANEAETAVSQETQPDRAISEATAAAAAASSRRDLLPNVDEINQTLRSTAEPRMIDTAERRQVQQPEEKSGFGKGFLLVVVLAALGVGTYSQAGKLSEALPQAAPLLDGYVASVDKGRAWLDGQVTALMQMLDGMSSEAAQEAPAEDPAPAEGADPVQPETGN
ncbi:zinc-ribbon domain-containing protein [Sagittula sp. S175]|uniref:zinc-ribbon domain-containing protein n=1 Tax=Sagittula sp. S175 TaxID=3415129 RepID=UPI003C7AB6B7